jgi:hypothetical protein
VGIATGIADHSDPPCRPGIPDPYPQSNRIPEPAFEPSRAGAAFSDSSRRVSGRRRDGTDAYEKGLGRNCHLRLAGEGHTSDDFGNLWEEFELSQTSEARFANSVDRAMPVLLNLANNGGSWLENGVGYERVLGRVGPQINERCPVLWDYIEEQLKDAHRMAGSGFRSPEGIYSVRSDTFMTAC